MQYYYLLFLLLHLLFLVSIYFLHQTPKCLLSNFCYTTSEVPVYCCLSGGWTYATQCIFSLTCPIKFFVIHQYDGIYSSATCRPSSPWLSPGVGRNMLETWSGWISQGCFYLLTNQTGWGMCRLSYLFLFCSTKTLGYTPFQLHPNTLYKKWSRVGIYVEMEWYSNRFLEHVYN